MHKFQFPTMNGTTHHLQRKDLVYLKLSKYKSKPNIFGLVMQGLSSEIITHNNLNKNI